MYKYYKQEIQLNKEGGVSEGFSQEEVSEASFEENKVYKIDTKDNKGERVIYYTKEDDTIPDDLRDGREVIDFYFTKK